MNPFKGVKVLIIGDVCLDRYIEGRITRKSPESDAMVFRKFRSYTKLGMAGNVAKNIKALGGIPTLLSVVGTKGPYERIINHLKKLDILSNIQFDHNRKTTIKTRIQDGTANILRMDEEDTEYVGFHYQYSLLTTMRLHMKTTDVVILQDYGKGVLYKKVIQETIKEAHALGKKILIDPNKNTPLEWYSGADMITPNAEEAMKLTQKTSPNDAFGASIHLRSASKNVVVTVGEKGMILSNDKTLRHFTTDKKTPIDVTGAGDTVVSILALGEAIGLPIEKSIKLANKAAAVVIGKAGASTCTFKELE